MKKSKCLILILMIFASLQCPKVFGQAKNKVQIRGTMSGILQRPAKLYLFLNQKLTDSAAVKGSSYQFNCNITDDTKAVIKGTRTLSLDGQASIALILRKGTINIVSSPLLNNVQITGDWAILSNDYQAALKPVTMLRDTLNSLITGEGYAKNAMLRADVRIRAADLPHSETEQLERYLQQSPKSPIGGFIVSEIYQLNYPDTARAIALAKKILPSQQIIANKRIRPFRSEMEKRLLAKTNALKAEEQRKNDLENSVSIGKKGVDFTLPDSAGNPILSSSYRGKYVLIDFWASWCHPCRAESPNLKKAFEKYKSNGFTILGVSLDGGGYGTKQSWLNAIKKDGLTWTQVADLKGSSDAVKPYNVTAIPRNFLIDPDGKIIAKDLRGEDLEKELALLFNR